jgi:DNA-binding transcriptional MocR family regulator
MIEAFFGSKTRVKILRQFLLNAEEKYYLRQLARDLSLQVNSVRRELKHLEACGLLVSADYHHSILLDSKSNNAGDKLPAKISKSDKKYYEVNKDFILFSEIRALVLKAQTMVGQNFLNELQEICRPKLLILTGYC